MRPAAFSRLTLAYPPAHAVPCHPVNDRPLYTVNGKQIMSELVALCGGRNVFALLDKFAPEIGIEVVVAANPQVIIATEGGGPGAIDQ